MKLPNTWKPSQKVIENSNIHRTMTDLGIEKYEDFWRWSVDEKTLFWAKTLSNLKIPFFKKFDSILDVSKGTEKASWLEGAKMNIVDACFQRDEQSIALIVQDNSGEIRKITHKSLLELVGQIANGLRETGIERGDFIAIDMPMTLESVAIYLAGIKAGNPVVTIADSFTPKEISIRLKITRPKLIFTQDYLFRAGKKIPLYEKILEVNPPKTIVFQADHELPDLRKDDLYFSGFLSEKTDFNTVPQNPNDPITILFSSGTTGEPKAIPWTQTTPIKCACDGFYHHDIHVEDVVCWPTNLGWMMGPWLIFATLINKATVALYYGAPMEEGFGKFVENAKVTMLGVVPSIVRHWKNSQCMEQFDWSSIKCFSSTGEVSNPEEMKYLMSLGKHKPVIEYCGGTEIGGGYVTSTLVQENIPGTFSTQALGGEFVLLNEEQEQTEQGEVFILPPILGLSNSLLNKDHFEVYYKDTPVYQNKLLRRHGDELQKLPNGYYKAQGRVDDAMNLGGIKVSSIQIEELVNMFNFIKESAAIAVSPKGGGPGDLVIYFVPQKDFLIPENLLTQIQSLIKNEINPLFKVKEIISIDLLPRTASGKVMRRELRALYENN